MVDPATVTAIIQALPYVIAGVEALYHAGKYTYLKYGPEISEIYRELGKATDRYEKIKILRENKGILLTAAGYLAITGAEIGTQIYRRLKILDVDKPKYKPSLMRATVQSALIIFGSLALTYFTLVPQKTTAHVIIPISTNVVGMILSFILLCIGTWLVLRKDKVT